MFTVKHNLSASLFKLSSWFCKPTIVFDKSTTSSAKSNRKMLMVPGINWIPCPPVFDTSMANSLMKKENIKGLSRQPCFTPPGQVKQSKYEHLSRTHAITELYIPLRAMYSFPFTPFFLNTDHSAFLFTESNGFLKSTKAHTTLCAWVSFFVPSHTEKIYGPTVL